MFSLFFRKKSPPPAPAPAKPVPPKPDPQAQAAAQEAQAAKKATWDAKLKVALGNDTALLAVANEAPLVDIKLAAVEALAGEEALKQAEREFRTHDRRVHRVAKQRYEALVKQRETREQAAALITSAGHLARETLLPASRLVELDRAWQALDKSVVTETQQAEFTRLRENLTRLALERAETQRAWNRWQADAAESLAGLQAALAQLAAADATPAGAVAEAAAKGRTIVAAAPGDPHAALAAKEAPALLEALQGALALVGQIEIRLALLDELQRLPAEVPASPAAPETAADAPAAVPIAAANTEAGGDPAASELVPPAPVPAEPAAPAVVTPSPMTIANERWRALPPVADAALAKALNARFDAWLRRVAQARKPQPPEKATDEAKPAKAAKPEGESAIRAKPAKANNAARNETLAAAAKAAEAALAEGQLAEARKHLAAIDETLNGGNAGGGLQARIDRLRAEFNRLKGWQQWGGGRAREDLVQEAEALAKAAADAAGEGEEKPAAKLPVKQHADAIDKLRERWKELDRLGGASSKELWNRFDEALKAAYVPIAAHYAKLGAEREQNLAGRSQLLAGLEALPLASPADESGAGAPPDWREIARTLENFQAEWRKLGPVEHTVPHKARDGVVERMKAAVARLEGPLQEARRTAQFGRERLVERAKALSADAQSRDVVTKVRELQAEWQQHAKSLPLGRQVEQALWTEFKAATDAVFNQRDAVFKARDAEFKANQTAREALIARLAELTADATAADIKRTLAEVDREWRHAGDPPKAEANALEAKYRAAREAAQQLLASYEQRAWQATCDALAAKLALCAEAEAGNGSVDAADVDARWAALPTLPGSWEGVLRGRLLAAGVALSSGGAVVKRDSSDEPLDTTLLRLEAALDLPSPPEFQAERRNLKLQAMKSALEDRRTVGNGANEVEQLLATALAQPQADAAQRQRLGDAIAAIRQNGARLGVGRKGGQ